ncbi:MAG: hypothetical protein Q8T11_16645 [Elusimicrobiota bacterium]|nr:hypothetical protein [Elusimicrobiota bacterium]
MRTKLTTAMFAAMALLAALPAAAEVSSPMVTQDPLMRQIMSRQLTLPSGGVTGSTRLGSGQAIEIKVTDPLAPLKPVEGLAPAPVKEKAAAPKVRRADAQLKKMSGEKRAADWSGRK